MIGILALDIPSPPESLGFSQTVEADDSVSVRYRLLPSFSDQDAISSLAEVVADLCSDERAVLVLYPQCRSAEAEQLIRLLRQMVVGSVLGTVPTWLPPLAAGVLVQLLRVSVDRLDLDAGQAGAAVAAVEQQLNAVSWVRSVTRLSSPSPSLAQHLGSWAAGRGFEVTSDSGIRWLRPKSKPNVLPDLEPGAKLTWAAVLRGEDRDLAWLRTTLAPTGLSVTTDLTQPETQRWFGTTRAAELVVYPTALDSLLAALEGQRVTVRCDWCAHSRSGRACIFCGHRPADADPSPAAIRIHG